MREYIRHLACFSHTCMHANRNVTFYEPEYRPSLCMHNSASHPKPPLAPVPSTRMCIGQDLRGFLNVLGCFNACDCASKVCRLLAPTSWSTWISSIDI